MTTATDHRHEHRTFGSRRMRAELADPAGKLPPADRDLEAAFIADLLDHDEGGEALAVVRDHVGSSMFSVGLYGMLYEAICDLRDMHAEEGRPETPIGRAELAAWLRFHTAGPGTQPCGVFLTDEEARVLRDLNGGELTRAYEGLVSARSRALRVEARAARIRDLAMMRRLIERMWSTAAVGYSDHELFRESVGELAREIQEWQTPTQAETEQLRQPLLRVLQRYLRPTAPGEEPLTTGLPDLDGILELIPGKLVVIGGRSGRGKSALALQIAMHVSRTSPVVFFTGEMKAEEQALRAICAEARVDSRAVRQRRLGIREYSELTAAQERVANNAIWFGDLKNRDVTKVVGILRREAKRFAREGTPLKCVVVDYLQRVRAGKAARPGANREQEVAAVAVALKDLAQELDLCIIAPAQLNADADNRPHERPLVSDIRESKGIENEADDILLVHNPGHHDRVARPLGAAPEPEQCELILGKNRAGTVGTAYVWMWPVFTRFDPMTAAQAEAAREEFAPERKGRR